MTYHNTTHQLGSIVKVHRQKAATQDQRIFAYMAKFADRNFTPSEIHGRVFSFACPLTSVRRSMSNLTNDGKLEKTTKQRDGSYGRPEYCWTVPAGQLRLI